MTAQQTTTDTSTVEMTYRDALNAALDDCLREDSNVLLLGEDIGDYGGAFKVTRDLQDRYGEDRVRDTSISENGFVSAAGGMALGGLRPVVEVLLADFIPICLDALGNQVAKLPTMTGGQARNPVTVRCTSGGYRRAGPQSGEMFEALVSHVPGWKVALPSTPADARGLLTAAIRDDGPVLIIEHMLLYATKGQVPDHPYETPLGSAAVRREGGDVTIVSYSHYLSLALEAAAMLEADGIDAEVIDLRTVKPLDLPTVKQSVLKTGRVVIAHEAKPTCGIGAELAAQLAADAEILRKLTAPITRVTSLDRPVPASEPLELACLGTSEDIAVATRRLF